MVDLHSLVDKFFYANRREYTVREGNVAYLDGSPLKRPFNMPVAQKIIALVIVVAALVIGLLFVNNTILASIRSTQQAEQRVADNLARQAAIETVPQLSSVVLAEDDAIRAAFDQAGYKTYDASSLSESGNLVLWRLPDDMSLEEAALMISQGINRLDAEQGSKLLNGSWEFELDRVNGTSAAIHYVDFSTGDPQVAIRNALEAEKFDVNSVGESGVDESGNNYSKGSIEIDGHPCTWSIHAIPLSDMYSISGLPEDACYVGVRITVQ